ncbi:hypothetical protein ABTX80_24880 [Streptomyces erythrochromogenes]|uniref:hypothetical protein n=1 Tax=Streptomyces erythrochromogenes TaxID=285574 RepID=UPI00331E14BA
MTPADELKAAEERLRDRMRMAGIVDADIAEPLAELLGYASRYAAFYDSLAGRPAPDPHPDRHTRHALAVARALLGTTDGSTR